MISLLAGSGLALDVILQLFFSTLSLDEYLSFKPI